MNENTSPPENLQESDQQKGRVSTDSTQENLQQQVHAKLDKCDTLIDLLEDNGMPEVSSKETNSGSTAYPEFGNPVSTKTSSGNISLQLKICTTEISDSKAQQIVAAANERAKEVVSVAGLYEYSEALLKGYVARYTRALVNDSAWLQERRKQHFRHEFACDYTAKQTTCAMRTVPPTNFEQ